MCRKHKPEVQSFSRQKNAGPALQRQINSLASRLGEFSERVVMKTSNSGIRIGCSCNFGKITRDEKQRSTGLDAHLSN